MAKNGRGMFKCPYCKGQIDNYEGDVPDSKPDWVDNDEALLAGEIEDDDLCLVCNTTGHLLVCDGDNCANCCHHSCANPPVNLANEPEQWFCSHCKLDRGDAGAAQQIEELMKERWQDDVYTQGPDGLDLSASKDL
jgi:hypothetical protein